MLLVTTPELPSGAMSAAPIAISSEERKPTNVLASFLRESSRAIISCPV